MRTSSGSERAPIFLMMLPRCTLAVISLTPSSDPICLFISPDVTNPMTSCSRGVNPSKRVRNFETATSPRSTLTVAFERELNRVEKILVAERLGQEFDSARLHGAHSHWDISETRI